MNNDLISRSALIDKIEILDRRYGSDFYWETRRIIDKVPTICGNNPKWCESCVSKGKCASTRPQGEWIKEPNGKTTDVYRCSVCNRSIMLCKGADLTKYPFCHCGAEMKGGTE